MYAMRALGNKDAPHGEALSCRCLDTLGAARTGVETSRWHPTGCRR